MSRLQACLARTRAGVCAALAAALLTLPATARSQEAAPQSFAGAAAAKARAAAASALDGAQGLARYALGLIGVDYKYGGNTPETGLDCSGLVQYVFQQVTGVTLPRSAKEMSRLGDKVALTDLKPGDLVFFNTRRFAYSHVGIYLGDSQFIHAPRRGREVEVTTIDKSYWQKRFNGARRLVGVMPELMPTFISEAQASPFEVVLPVAAAESTVAATEPVPAAAAAEPHP